MNLSQMPFFINDETYSEMEKARDLLCSLCYEVKCKDCQIVKLMAEAKAARDRSKEKQESYKAEPSFRKQLTLSDWGENNPSVALALWRCNNLRY